MKILVAMNLGLGFVLELKALGIDARQWSQVGPFDAPDGVILERTRSVWMQQHTEYHQDGSVRAIGPMVDGVPVGYWEWFRLDGTKLRSGYFEHGEPTGEWTTYDKKGQIYKVTQMKSKTPQG